jgi:DNA-binding MarR family transcriptional regulator
MRMHSMQRQLMSLHSGLALAILHPMTSATTARAQRGAPVEEWRVLLDRHAKVSCALERSLQDEHGIGLSEFEILDRLVDANCGKYRMSDLAQDIYLSQSALSRAVARLEQDGLVDRSMCSDDRRAIFVCLTGEGATRHREALPTHREVLALTWGD